MTDVDYTRPCRTKTINDNFAAHKARGSYSPGVDFNCATGDDIFATAPGKVVSATQNLKSSAGIAIVIKHRDGNFSHYFHLSKLLVSNGDRVTLGQLIAKSGNTGTATTGAHLHFAIKDRTGAWLDPERLLAKELKERKRERAAARAAAALIVSDVPTPIAESPETVTG
jgi:murein DD-endopeptidase MepM/ murein hydrolase activator NlpD